MTPEDAILAEILLLIGLAGPLIVRLVAWPSTRNYVAVIELPQALIAFGLGCFIFPFEEISRHSLDVGRLLDLIRLLLISLLVYTAIFCSVFFRENRATAAVECLVDRVATAGRDPSSIFVIAVVFFFAAGAALLAISYVGMGFVPAFAVNPFAAKYFSGAYEAPYRPWAPLFRGGMNIFGATTPFLFIVSLNFRTLGKFLSFLLFLIYSVLVMLSLRRGILGSPILLTGFILFVYWRNGKYSWLYAMVFCVVFTLGAMVTPIISDIVAGREVHLDISAAVAGVPDVQDQLWFWDRWEMRHWTLSFGRTIFGAIVPVPHFTWNVAVVTLTVIGSPPWAGGGGFRLPEAVLGMIAYGWIGAIMIMALSGFWGALVIAAVRHAALKKTSEATSGLLPLMLPVVLGHVGVFLFYMSLDELFYLCVNGALFGLLIYTRRSPPALAGAVARP